MEMLETLGINAHVFAHLIMFIISYLALSQLVFKPYIKAYNERARRSDLSEDAILNLQSGAESLQQKLDTASKELHAKTRAIYEEARADGQKVSGQLTSDSRGQANSIIESARVDIAKKISAAKEEAAKDVASVGNAIAAKILGRELK